MEVTLEGSVVEFYQHSESIYSIRREELADVLPDKKDISDWIHQLLDKSWIEKEALYDLAKIIQSEFPQNNISWENTFFMVEKKFYLAHATSVDKEFDETAKNESLVASLFRAIKVGREEQNESVNKTVHEIARGNLKLYGLL